MSSSARKRPSKRQASSSVSSIVRRSYALTDELPLEVGHEAEDAAVVVGERLFADDRAEALQLSAAAEEGRQLIGDAAMVGARAPLTDPGVHQPAQRGEHIDRRVDPAPVEFA